MAKKMKINIAVSIFSVLCVLLGVAYTYGQLAEKASKVDELEKKVQDLITIEAGNVIRFEYIKLDLLEIKEILKRYERKDKFGM